MNSEAPDSAGPVVRPAIGDPERRARNAVTPPAHAADLRIAPLDSTAWPDLCRLFGPNGAVGGCWCMWWRRGAKEWTAGAGAAVNDANAGGARSGGGQVAAGSGDMDNRAAFARVVEAGEPSGLLAYRGDDPIGWCAVAPRVAYPRLLRSRTIGPRDPDEPDVWAVTCFFINRHHRNAGVGAALLTAAVAYAAERGAAVVEGYPVDTAGARRASGDLFTGTVGLFTTAGFRVEERPNPGKRLVMRRTV